MKPTNPEYYEVQYISSSNIRYSYRSNLTEEEANALIESIYANTTYQALRKGIGRLEIFAQDSRFYQTTEAPHLHYPATHTEGYMITIPVTSNHQLRKPL